MNTEFHYYITYLIAARAGFKSKEASLLAYSSQYVDDNDIVFEICKNTPYFYSNYISQTMDILKPKKQLLRIYPLFHFIPGNAMSATARRKDGKLHLLNTTPDSDNAKNILSSALRSGNVYRMGIACHAYADTWAHQNFIGYYDVCNAMDGLMQKPKPNIGHADAGHSPDEVNHSWPDERLISTLTPRNNNEIFLSAAGRMFEELKRFCCPHCQQQSIEQEKALLLGDLKIIMGLVDPDERIQNYCEIAQREEYGGEKLERYDNEKWIDEAVKENVRSLKMKTAKGIFRIVNIYLTDRISPLRNIYTWKNNNDYQNSNWYKFQEAVKEHQKESWRILYDTTLKEMEIENW
ncbi:MAG: hypothetical protein GX434_03355 [Peptococcaceae bacterium]|nr:hypothetical protein [Peptococcaceae bacterium]